jgi:hypothetical protein
MTFQILYMTILIAIKSQFLLVRGMSFVGRRVHGATKSSSEVVVEATQVYSMVAP